MPSRLYRILASEGLVSGREKSARVTTKKVTFRTPRGKGSVTMSGPAKDVAVAELYLESAYSLTQEVVELDRAYTRCEEDR